MPSYKVLNLGYVMFSLSISLHLKQKVQKEKLSLQKKRRY